MKNVFREFQNMMYQNNDLKKHLSSQIRPQTCMKKFEGLIGRRRELMNILNRTQEFRIASKKVCSFRQILVAFSEYMIFHENTRITTKLR